MALYECLIGNGGGSGELVETDLWTNSSPSTQFSAKDIDLSGVISDIEDYDYYKVEFCLGVNNTSIKGAVMFDPGSLAIGAVNLTTNIALSVRASNSAYYTRAFYWTSNRKGIHFNGAYKDTATGSETGYCVPTKIIGIRLV